MPAARLVLVGDGPERVRARARRGRLRRGRAIEFRGSLSARRGAADGRRRRGGAALERLGEPPARGCRGAVGRGSCRRDRRRRRAGGRPRRREWPARAAGRPEELAAAMRRVLEEPGLRERLAAAAKPSVEAISSEASTAGSRRCSRRRPDEREPPARPLRRPRPPSAAAPDWLAKKWDAVEQQLDYRFLGAAEAGSAFSDERFRLSPPARPRRLDGSSSTCGCRSGSRVQLREFRPDAVVAADPFVGAAVAARSRARRRRDAA